MSKGTPEMEAQDFLEAQGIPVQRQKRPSRRKGASGVSSLPGGLYLPLRTYSEANLRQHWATRAKRVKSQRWMARAVVREKRWAISGPTVVTLTRVAPRKLDSDNLARSMKAIRDGIADAVGVDDGDERITWDYRQMRGKPREYAVIVQMRRVML